MKELPIRLASFLQNQARICHWTNIFTTLAQTEYWSKVSAKVSSGAKLCNIKVPDLDFDNIAILYIIRCIDFEVRARTLKSPRTLQMLSI